MRRVLAAMGLAVALLAGACGNGEGDGTSASGDLPLLPSSGGGGAGAERAETATAASGASGAGALVADAESDDATGMVAPAEPYQPIEYRLADDIDAMGGKAAAYRLDAVVDEEAVQKLADAFGVEGEPREDSGTWQVGSSGRALYVAPDGSFNLVDDTGVKTAETSAVCSSDGRCETGIPVEAPKPANLPTDAAAKDAAAELFEKAGIDLGGREARVDRSDYNVAVAFASTIDDTEVEGWGFIASFGDDAEVQYVNGSLANPSKVGDYPLVDTKAAYERWTSGMSGGGRVGIAVDTAEPAVGAPEPAPVPADDSDAVAPDTVPAEPVPTLPPKIVEIDRVERVLLMEYARCPGDPVYLVPGYRLYAGDAPYATIPAVADEYLQSAATSGGDDPVSSSDVEREYVDPCGNAAKTEPAREPESGGYPPVTIE